MKPTRLARSLGCSKLADFFIDTSRMKPLSGPKGCRLCCTSLNALDSPRDPRSCPHPTGKCRVQGPTLFISPASSLGAFEPHNEDGNRRTPNQAEPPLYPSMRGCSADGDRPWSVWSRVLRAHQVGLDAWPPVQRGSCTWWCRFHVSEA